MALTTHCTYILMDVNVFMVITGFGYRHRKGTYCGYLYVIVYTKNSYMYLSKNQDDKTSYSQLQYIALWSDLRQSIQRGRNTGQDRPTRRPDKSPVDSLVRSLDQERQAYPPICKELVERNLDRTLSTYIKCQENPDSAERCPSEAQQSCKYIL